jgi:single-strand DNA-binding protein
MTTHVSAVGNATRDPELRYTSGGRAVTTFGLASNRRYQVNGEWQEEVSFYNIVVWGDMAENVAACVSKGTRLVITGRMQQRSWETDEGEKRSVIEFVADEVGASLKWAQAQIEKTTREKPTRAEPETPAYGDEEPFS